VSETEEFMKDADDIVDSLSLAVDYITMPQHHEDPRGFLCECRKCGSFVDGKLIKVAMYMNWETLEKKRYELCNECCEEER
jgi:hypothetical protein